MKKLVVVFTTVVMLFSCGKKEKSVYWKWIRIYSSNNGLQINIRIRHVVRDPAGEAILKTPVLNNVDIDSLAGAGENKNTNGESDCEELVGDLAEFHGAAE